MFQPLLDNNVNAEFIEKKRFDLYMKEMLPHFLGGIFTCAPFWYFIFKDQFTWDIAPLWFAIDAVFALSTGLLYYFFYKHRDEISFITWKKLSYVPIVIYSFYVAASPWLLIQSNGSIYLYTLIVMAISLTGTMAYASAYYLPRHVMFLSLPLLSLAIKTSAMELDHAGVIYAVLLFLWLSSFSFSRHINKSLLNAIEQEYELIQARLDAESVSVEKSRFMAAASHDIRQPLQAINLFVNALQHKNENNEDKTLFERLEASVDGMSELLNNMLDVSKLDAQVVTPIPQHLNLSTLLNKIQHEFEPCAQQKNIVLKTCFKDCTVLADPVLLERVLGNLLANAVRYTHSGSIDVATIVNTDSVNISVSDTGQGIPEEEKAAIFKEFYQLNNPERDRSKGLGLGLAIVKRLCLLQAWSLQLSSQVDAGSCFTITLPLGDKEQVKNAEPLSLSSNLQGVNALIIDDEEDVCFSLALTMKSWGCTVHTVESADAACEKLQSMPLWRPNLIISDYRLRENKTGTEAIKQIRKYLSENIIAIIISGDTAPGRIQEIEASGLTMLHKPVKPGKLRSVIQHKMKHEISTS